MRPTLLLVVLLLWTTVGSGQTAPTHISGRVVDAASAQPVENAVVAIERSPGGQVAYTMTGRDGTFQVGVPEGGGILAVRHSGYAVYRTGLLGLTSVQIALNRPASVVGRLVGPDGVQLTGIVTITTTELNNTVIRSVPVEAGRFVASGLAPTAALLVGRADGRGPSMVRTVLQANRAAEVALVSPLEGRVAGVVLDAAGAPVAGARLELDYPTLDPDGRVLAQYARGRLLTGEDGRFLIYGLVPDVWLRLEVSTRFGNGDAELSVEPGGAREVEIRLSTIGTPTSSPVASQR